MIEYISKKENIFTRWLKAYKGSQAYISLVRKKNFEQSSSTSIEKRARFFIINLSTHPSKISSLIKIIQNISNKFSSKQSKRVGDRKFSPYLHLTNFSIEKYVELKHHLNNYQIKFIDGHIFKGSGFVVNSIVENLPCHSNIRLKLIDEIFDVNETLCASHSCPVEIFEFYYDSFEENLIIPSEVAYTPIHVDSLEEIIEITK